MVGMTNATLFPAAPAALVNGERAVMMLGADGAELGYAPCDVPIVVERDGRGIVVYGLAAFVDCALTPHPSNVAFLRRAYPGATVAGVAP